MSEVFKSNHLREVICEIRFPPQIQVDGEKHLFCQTVSKDFPNFSIPNVPSGVHPILLPTQLSNPDLFESLNFSIFSFSFHTQKYTHFDYFKDKAIKFIDVFSSKFNIQEYIQVGLRYINSIPVIREDKIIPVEKYFNFVPFVPKSLDKNPIDTFDSSLTLIKDVNRKLKLTIKHIEEAESQRLILDIDSLHYGKTLKTNLDSVLSGSHELVEGVFLEMISESYKEVLRGRGLD